jgi:ATP-dependent DNA helicase RecG
MTRDELEEWVRLGESERQEFKATTGQRTDAAKTLCAMLNHRGGRVLFGVQPKGASITGQQVTDKTIDDVVHELREIDPPVFPSVERVGIGPDKEVIVVEVSQGQRRPYTYKGQSYRRVGTNTLKMSRDEYNRLLLEQLHATARWENEPAAGWTVDDLDVTEIVRTLEEAVRRGRSEDPGTRAPADLLRGFGLLRQGQLLRAAVVLFARPERLLPDYPQCLLRLARFRGTDRTEFLDNRQYHGNAFDLLLRAERFLRDHLPIAGRVVPNLFERIDDPLYPPAALRESLANALCHRDYSIGGGSVGVAIYDDRLEVTSSGMLHFGLTVEDLFRLHESLPWNPLIAGAFYRRGIIEQWGRGTLKMAELTQQAGLPRPEIEEAGGGVTVRFRPSRYLPPQRVGHDLTPRQQEILRVLGDGQRRPPRAIVAAFGGRESLRAIRDDWAFLKQLGLVESAGWGRGSVWFLRGQTDAAP